MSSCNLYVSVVVLVWFNLLILEKHQCSVEVIQAVSMVLNSS